MATKRGAAIATMKVGTADVAIEHVLVFPEIAVCLGPADVEKAVSGVR